MRIRILSGIWCSWAPIGRYLAFDWRFARGHCLHCRAVGVLVGGAVTAERFDWVSAVFLHLRTRPSSLCSYADYQCPHNTVSSLFGWIFPLICPFLGLMEDCAISTMGSKVWSWSMESYVVNIPTGVTQHTMGVPIWCYWTTSGSLICFGAYWVFI